MMQVAHDPRDVRYRFVINFALKTLMLIPAFLPAPNP